MKPLQQVERWLGKHVERLSANLTGGDQPKETLEIRREMLSKIAEKVEAKGGGEYIFPYSQVTVTLSPKDAEQRAIWEAAFVDDHALQTDTRDLLRDAGCQADNVEVVVVFSDDTAFEPFTLEFQRVEKPAKGAPATPPKARPAAWLYVVQGRSERPEYFVGKDLTNLGRLREVISKQGGLRRRNDVAFDDEETTVSREHAHILFGEGKFRLFNDSGETNTRLFRDGRAVSTTGARGTQLRSGDEIHLGDARLRFETGD